MANSQAGLRSSKTQRALGSERVKGVVRAAGGVISRRGACGEPEVLLVYRTGKARDWSFPKGRVEAGETHEMCALREVHEETRLVCELGRELPSVAYRDRRGRSKVVRYWTMQVIRGAAAPRNEVTAVRWLDIDSALTLLTYARDRKLLEAFATMSIATQHKQRLRPWTKPSFSGTLKSSMSAV